MTSPPKKPELLAPVRDEVSFRAALAGGADSVYFGVGGLNMRVNSRGIEPDELARIVRMAHDVGVRVYVTLNTIVYDAETGLVRSTMHTIKQAGADAVICWDPAVIGVAREMEVPIHISTQANISNAAAVDFYADLGAERVVLARELSLEQIKEIRQQCDVEVEVFAHGAMCVSVSGRCFLSQFMGGRSANRGECLQPCRHEFSVVDDFTGDELRVSDGYLLSAKDLCTIGIVDRMLDAGIDALKIEGRSRPGEYVKTTVGAYRRAIDAVVEGTYDEALRRELLGQLETVYHRGFSTGFLLGRPGDEAWAARRNSASTVRKVFVGRVLNYFKTPRIAHVNVMANPISIGELLQIEGATTGLERFRLESLREETTDTEVDLIKKGEVTFPTPMVVREGDQVYKIVDAVLDSKSSPAD